MSAAFVGATEAVIPAWLQPLTVLELCAARDLPLDAVLPGTGIFVDDLPLAQRRLSLPQFHRLLENAQRRWPGGDFAFQLGHALAHHGWGPLADHLAALPLGDWGQALGNYALLAAPGLHCFPCPLSADTVLIQFSSSARAQLDASGTCALITGLQRLLKQHPGGRLAEVFLRDSPGFAQEQYWVHWGKMPRLRAPFDGVLLQLASGGVAAASPQTLRCQLARSQCDMLLPPQPVLLSALRSLLLTPSSPPPNLLQCAATLQVSPATLKRRLREQGLTFQAVLDDCLRQRAVAQLLQGVHSLEQISELLSFHDSSNFRRAFKRWTGTTPSQMRVALKALLC